MTAFYILGSLTAAWAVLVAALGITRHGFPGTPRATRAVMAISAAFFAAAVGSAVIGGALEEEDEAEAEEAEAEAAPEEEPAGGGEAAAGQELELSAVPSGDLAFDTSELQAEPGSVSLIMANPSPVPHNVSLEGQGVDEEGETVGQGSTSTVTAEVDRGRYTFYCSVPGHREGGMEGTLSVE